MTPSRFQKIVRLSRDRGALIKASLVLAGGSLVLSMILSAVLASGGTLLFEAGTLPAWTTLPDPASGYLAMARDLVRLEGSLLSLALRRSRPLHDGDLDGDPPLLPVPGPAVFLIGLAALLLGVVAAMLASYAALVQEGMRGFRFRAEDPVMRQFLYFLAGVSLREESLKLLCFAPLAIAVRRGRAIDALVLAGLTGLGFAFQENLSVFFFSESGRSAWILLLTSTVLHSR